MTVEQVIGQAFGRAGINGRKVAERRIMSRSSYYEKRRKPKRFTLDELGKLDEIVHFSNEEILALFGR